jgi:feruloyl-CoA synthase
LESGDKPALGQRGADGEWKFTSFAQLKRDMDAATQWLMDQPRAGPVLILAGNTPAFAVMSFAAQASGRAACPVSVTYAALGGDYGRLAHVIAKVKPAVVFAEDSAMASGALRTLDLGGATIVTTDPSRLSKPATAYAEVLATAATGAVAESIAALKPHDRAALMLTSGSTGLPKVVPITFDNLAANSAQCQQTIGEAAGWHEAMLDWLPWHHAAGAFVLRTTLLEGGTLYIDDGKPAPGLFEASIKNLREISVSYFNNVPLGYAMLVDALEKDAVLRATFFKKMRLMLYGGAGLSQTIHDRLQAAAIAETGHRIMMTSGYGMTETVSAFMVIHFETDKVGIGLPAPGAILKLSPVGERYEVRAKGPNVTAGYLDEPEKTADAFDEEGFYRTGDLAVFHDRGGPKPGPGLRGSGGGGVQAVERHVGLRRRAARRHPEGVVAIGAGSGAVRRRPPLSGRHAVAEGRCRPGRDRQAAGGLQCRPERRRGAGEAGPAAHRSAQRQRARDFRQGHHQPSRGHRSSRRSGGAAVRRDAGRGCDRAGLARQTARSTRHRPTERSRGRGDFGGRRNA